MDKFVVLSMSGESKDVAKALSNDTAISIMNTLAEKKMSATELSKKLKMSISTVQYNLELLKKVGLIQDTAYRYSEKGKKVLYYEPAKKLIILAPEKEKDSIINLFKNRLLIPIVLGITAIIGLLWQSVFGSIATIKTGLIASIPQMETTITSAEVIYIQETSNYLHHQPGFIFFLGALFAIKIILIFRFVKKRMKKYTRKKK